VNQTVSFLVRNGYWFLFAAILAEQAGLPIPAVTVLLAMGALAGQGRFSLAAALAVAVAACLVADVAWFCLGRRYGSSVLRFLCRVSLEPDSCVRRTENAFVREGGRPLLYAKFVPGLSTLATPVAGLAGLSLGRFLALDAAGAVWWTGSYLVLGYVFSAQIEDVVEAVMALGFRVVLAAAGAFALYVIWKLDQRRRFRRELEVARIDPEELLALLHSAPDRVVVVDLRTSLERDREPATVPGAIVLAPGELDERHHEIPRDRDVVLFCT